MSELLVGSCVWYGEPKSSRPQMVQRAVIMMVASPVSICLYITCDGAKLKLPRVTASKRVAQLAKAFVKSVSGKPAGML